MNMCSFCVRPIAKRAKKAEFGVEGRSMNRQSLLTNASYHAIFKRKELGRREGASPSWIVLMSSLMLVHCFDPPPSDTSQSGEGSESSISMDVDSSTGSSTSGSPDPATGDEGNLPLECVPGCGINEECEDEVCVCASGFEDSAAGCVLPPCNGNPCYEGVECTNVYFPKVDAECGSCPGDLVGDGKECFPSSTTCADDPCFEEVECTPCFGGDECSNPTGPEGFQCGSCPPGYEGTGISCEDIDGCATGPCFDGVACEDVAAPNDGYSCGDCPDDFEGDGETCTPVCDGECMPPAPSGWSGPFATWEGDADESIPSCPAEFPIFGQASQGEPVIEDGECECGCQPATGGVCEGRIIAQDNGPCDPGNSATTLPNRLSCNSRNVSAGSVLRDQYNGGSCAPFVASATFPEPLFNIRSVTCEAQGLISQGCDSATTCVPRASGRFSTTCIVRTGHHSCPANGPWTEQQFRYSGVIDNRSCGTCTCGSISDRACHGSFDIWTNSNCSGTAAQSNIDADIGCAFVTGSSIRYEEPAILPTFTCPPSPGTVENEVVLLGETTYCCEPT